MASRISPTLCSVFFLIDQNPALYLLDLLHHTKTITSFSLEAEVSRMPSQQFRYPLRSHDIPMNPDLFTLHKPSGPSRNRTLDGIPQSTMPSFNHATHSISEYLCIDKPFHDGGCFTDPKALWDWQDLQDSIMSFPESSFNQINQSFSSPRFDSTDEVYTPSKLDEQTVWDCSAPNGPALAYPSPMLPRSYPSEEDENMRTLLEPVLQAHAPASYTISSRCQEVHQTIINTQQSRRDVLTIPGRENYHSHIGENLAGRRSPGSAHSSPSTIKRECSLEISPGVNKRGEDNLSPSTVADDDSDGEGSAHVEPYAQLIYRALKSAPGHAMVLKEIYEWFEHNTDKAKNAASKGWQNSIRHNLSMNGV